MRIKNLLSLFIVFVLCPIDTHAITLDSLNQMEKFLLKNNRALEAKRSEILVTQDLPKIRAAFDDPMLGVEFEGIPAQNSGRLNDANRYFISQTLPFFGKLNDLDAIANFELQAMQAEYQTLENQLLLDLRTAYYEWTAAERIKEIYIENLSLLEALIGIADTRYQAGIDSQAIPLRMRTDAYHWKALKLGAETQTKFWKNQIRGLLALEPGSPIEHQPVFSQVDRIFPERERLRQKLAEENPELIQALIRIKKTEKEKSYTEKVWGPDWNLMLGFTQNSMGPDQGSVQLQFNLPWLNSKNNAQISQSQKLIDLAQRSFESLHLKQEMILEQAVDQLENNLQFFMIHQEALPFAKQAMEIVRLRYQINRKEKTDSVSAMEMMEAYRTYLEARLDLVQHERDYWVSLAKLKSLFNKAIKEE